MQDWDVAGKAQTVQGVMNPDDLGVTLTHEHLLIDLSPMYKPSTGASDRDFWEKPVSIETLGRIRHYAAPNRDNTILSDISTAIDEANLYKQYGGNTLVDATSNGIARDPVGLARISHATGVNVIMGSSYYVAPSHPPDMDQRTEDAIAEEIVRDVTEGADGTLIRSGIIGEVGCSWPLTDNERKVLRAASIAQRETGASILIHPGRDEGAPAEIIEVLAESGADISRVIMGHLDRTVADFDILRRLAGTGCYLEWDLFGNESSYYPLSDIDMPSDAQRMDTIKRIIEAEGCGDRVVIAHDICTKHRLVRYGGHGYGHILENIVPRMRRKGFTEEQVQAITAGNPANILSFV
jgi:phosphotriesterase-related protein